MTSKLTKYGMMIIASVLLVAMVFAGAGAAAIIQVGTANDLDAAFSNADDGDTIKLTASFTMNENIGVTKNVILNLNGKTLTANEGTFLFSIGKGVTFTLTDTKGGGKLKGNGNTGDNGGAVRINGGTFNMNGGSIEDCHSAAGGAVFGGISIGSSATNTFNMYGGRIADCTATEDGGAVYLVRGQFNMTSGASIVNCTSGGDGGAVHVGQTIINMNGGSIEDCHSAAGGAVYLNQGDINMIDGSIIDCTAENTGGAVHVYPGTFNMEGGSIINCDANIGGGVHVSQGTFNLTRGNIADCLAGEGGAVSLEEGGTFNMKGGSIINCTVYDGGGAVLVGGTSTTFNMSGDASIMYCEGGFGGAVWVGSCNLFMMDDKASISFCNATSPSEVDGGGAVYLNGGTFTMSNGSISYCNAEKYGGGIKGKTSATVILSGGSITNCNCDDYEGGGGIDIEGESSKLKISGTVTITDNTNVDTVNSNVYLDRNDYLVLDGDFDGSIGIYSAGNLPAAGGEFGSTESSSCKGAGNFFADNDHTLVGSIVGTDLVWTSTYVEVSNWAQLNKSVAEWIDTETARTVVVNQDIIDRGYDEDYEGIEVSGNVIIMPKSSTTDEEVLIDGKNQGSLFTVVKGGNLTLCGNTTGGTAILNLSNGYFEAEGGGIYITGGSSLTLAKGAKITNCNADYGGAVYVNEGTFTMAGDASISDCTAINGGAVYLNHGTFNLADEDASITYCTATSYGGGVFVYDVATFPMQDGCIRYCEAGECGGGIGTDFGAIVILSGGSITDCSCGDGYTGGGVDVADWCTFKVSGPVIVTDNTEDGTENNNVYIYNYENLTLAGDFTGSVGITYSGGYPEEGLQFGITESSSFKGAKNFFADNANLVGSIDGNTLVWTVPTVHKKSSGQSGSTVILTETPTATPTAAVTQAPADVPTAAPIKPSAQQTQASPAPFVGLVLGLGAAAVLLRLRK